MKTGPLLGLTAGAFLAILGILGLINRHTHSVPADLAQPDPCASPSPDQRPDNCPSHGHSSGYGYMYSSWRGKRASSHGESEAESAGHAGFGEGAAGHAGGGGE